MIITDYRDERRERLKICDRAYLYDFQIRTLERKEKLFRADAIIIIIILVIVVVIVVVVVVDSYAFEPEHNYVTEVNAHRILKLSADIPMC